MTVVATAGHVDHGKSSLVLGLSGTDPDRLIEEQQRGLTIDLGFAAAVLPSGRTIEIIDVPGHVRFLKNMLAGVGGVSGTIFVVAADDGWMPQSEEHLQVLELLGVTHGIVVLSKVDTVDEEMVQLARLELEERLADTFLSSAPIIECAAPTGRGIDEVRAALDDLLDRMPSTPDHDRPRLWVDRSFAPAGVGTVVTGTLTDGTLHTDETVEVGADARPCRVRGIQTHGRTVEEIGPGHRVALNLGGISHHDVARGDAVVTSGRWHRTDTFDATLSVLPTLTHRISRRGAYVAYLGSGEFPVRLRVLGDSAIDPGDDGHIRAHLSSRLPLVIGDRYILREVGRDETVGGGSILDVDPVTRAAAAAPTGLVADLVAERGRIDVDTLYRFTGTHHAPTVGEWVVDPAVLHRLAEDLTARAVAAGEEGVELAPLSELDRAVAAALVEDAPSAGVTLEIGDGVLRVAGSAAALRRHPLLDRLTDEGLTPAPVEGDDVAAARAMERAGLVVHSEGMWFTTTSIDTAVSRLRQLLDDCPEGFTVAMARDALGITRKHVLPLLAYLDGTGRTRRRGDVRIAGPRLDPPDPD